MDRIAQLLRFLDENPGDSFLLFALAKEYEKVENQAEAFLYFQKLLETDPTYVGLYYHFGKWHERAGDFDKALEIYDSGMKMAKSQGDQHAFNELAGAKMQLSDPED